jgi:hypothetical protein
MDAPASFDLTTLLINQDPGGIWTMGFGSDHIIRYHLNLSGCFYGTITLLILKIEILFLVLKRSLTVQVVVLRNPSAGTPVQPSVKPICKLILLSICLMPRWFTR